MTRVTKSFYHILRNYYFINPKSDFGTISPVSRGGKGSASFPQQCRRPILRAPLLSSLALICVSFSRPSSCAYVAATLCLQSSSRGMSLGKKSLEFLMYLKTMGAEFSFFFTLHHHHHHNHHHHHHTIFPI